ncbi:hypothetical protein [Nitrosopumilus sp.]|uniref:hypothetical protein n=1 Tax=Nitrosopumilus sp. TaxID=2024843 RepID=UPI00292DD607|nr:hypothetical protein [Nitrosopumilus sp.]
MEKNDAGNDKKTLGYDDSGDIYNYPRKIRWAKNRLAKMYEGQKCIQFLDKLKLIGSSNTRLCYYSDRFSLMLAEFEKLHLKLKNTKNPQCESILSNLISQKNYSGEKVCICIDPAEIDPLCKDWRHWVQEERIRKRG